MLRCKIGLIKLAVGGLTVLGAPNAHARPLTAVLRLTGAYEAGGAPGSFSEVINPRNGWWRADVVTGPLAEESGYDGAPWLRHDHTLIGIDLPSAVLDARARALILANAQHDPALRRYVNELPTAEGRHIRVVAPGASPFTAVVSDSGDIVSASIDGDAGPFTILLTDWRTIPGVGRVAMRREERTANGDKTIFAATAVAATDETGLERPATDRHDLLSPSPSPVAFTFDHGDHGHIVVQATIDGLEAKLVFDTGAANYLTPEAAVRYGLTVGGGVDIAGVGGGGLVGGYANVHALSIGPATLRDTVTIVGPLPPAAVHPRPDLTLHGLTGAEFLTAFTTTINYAKRTLSFSAPRAVLRDTGSVPFKTDGIGIFVPATVDGHRGWFRLDTGDAGTLTLFASFASAAGFDMAGERLIQRGEVGGDLVSRRVHFRKVRLAGVTLRSLGGIASEQSKGSFASRSIAGNIGAGILAGSVLTIDYTTRRVVIMPARN